MQTASHPVVVIGGGLAGLLAALALRRRGQHVLVVERGATMGGRARSTSRNGFVWNQGPHAVFRAGALAESLRSLEIPIAGHRVGIGRSFVLIGDEARGLPTSALGLVVTTLLTPRERFVFGRFHLQASRAEAARFADVSVSDYLTERLPEGRARDLAQALFRLSTYGGDATRMSAECGLRQLQLSNAGVDYVDGGWQSIVDSLTSELTERTVALRTHAHAVAIEGDGPFTVRLANRDPIRASAVVVTGSPADTAALVEGTQEGPLHAFAAIASPVHAACLDLALTSVPDPKRTFALGIDRPTYASLHSAVARLCPDGGGLVHAAVQLGDRASDPGEDRARCESAVELLQPGFRDVVADARFLPHMTVHHALVTASMGGFRGRPSFRVDSRPGVFIAGDWVGARGLLADASAASALDAAQSVVAYDTTSRLPSYDAA